MPEKINDPLPSKDEMKQLDQTEDWTFQKRPNPSYFWFMDTTKNKTVPSRDGCMQKGWDKAWVLSNQYCANGDCVGIWLKHVIKTAGESACESSFYMQIFLAGLWLIFLILQAKILYSKKLPQTSQPWEVRLVSTRARFFSVVAPTLWNALLSKVHQT